MNTQLTVTRPITQLLKKSEACKTHISTTTPKLDTLISAIERQIQQTNTSESQLTRILEEWAHDLQTIKSRWGNTQMKSTPLDLGPKMPTVEIRCKKKVSESYTVPDLLKVVKRHASKTHARHLDPKRIETQFAAKVKLMQVAFLIETLKVCKKMEKEEAQKIQQLQTTLVNAQTRFSR